MEIKIVVSGSETSVSIPWKSSENCMLTLIKVGDNIRPAKPEDLKDVARCLGEALKDSEKTGRSPILITHHAITTEMVPIYYAPYQGLGGNPIAAQSSGPVTDE